MVSSRVVEALLNKRIDLEHFAPISPPRACWSDAVPKTKHLPQLLHFQEHVSGPIKELHILLERLHEYYNMSELTEAFLTDVALLPISLANCSDSLRHSGSSITSTALTLTSTI
jgi:hypothetical protein